MAPTPSQLLTITHSHTYGLGDALKLQFNRTSDLPIPSLFADACAQPDNTHNCTTSCTTLEQLFGSLDTLYNCVAWPQVYSESINGTLSPAALTLAKSLGVPKQGGGDPTLPSLVSNNIQDCLLDSCDQDDNCGRNAPDYRKRSQKKLTGQAYYGPGNYFDPCPHITAPATADVAGIGVFISYVMQLRLALFAFIFSIPWRRGARSISNTTLALFRKSRPSAVAREERLSNSNLDPVDDDDEDTSDLPHQKHASIFSPSEAVVPFVVEFQKAQCYFMLATNIASLVIQHRGGVDPGSFQQLYNTYIFIKVIAIGGYLPITFTLLTLRMLCKMGWLMLTLSIASVGVSIANLFTKRDFSPSQEDLAHLRDVSKTGGPQSCGGHNPIAWCYNRISIGGYVFGDTNEDDGAYNMLIFCLIVLVILTLEHFFSSADATNRSTRNTLLKPLFCWNNRHRRDILAGGKRSTPTSRVLAVMKRFLNLYFSPLSSYSTSTLLRTMPMI